MTRSSTIYHGAVFALTLPILSWVTVAYIIPKFQLDMPPVLLISAATLLQILCTLFPERDKTATIHTVLAAASAISLWLFIGNLLRYELPTFLSLLVLIAQASYYTMFFLVLATLLCS